MKPMCDVCNLATVHSRDNAPKLVRWTTRLIRHLGAVKANQTRGNNIRKAHLA